MNCFVVELNNNLSRCLGFKSSTVISLVTINMIYYSHHIIKKLD